MEKEKKKWYKRWWAIVLYVFVFLMIIASMGEDKNGENKKSTTQETAVTNDQAQNQQVEQPAIKVSAAQLSEEYNANQVAADAKYKDKTLEISGVIDDIQKDILDTPYIILRGNANSFFGVQCMFSKEDEAKLVNLSKEQNIVLRGNVSSEFIGNVIVRGCSIVQ